MGAEDIDANCMGANGAPRRRAQVLRKEVVSTGFLRVERAEVRHSLFSGGEATVMRESLERGDSAAVLLVDWRVGAVQLLEQFRYPALSAGDEGWLIEIPAGVVGEAETPAEAARRETQEEAGFAVQQLEPIATFYPSPGACSERIHLFYASAIAADAAAPTPDPTEDLRLIWRPIDDFLAAARAGRIVDGKTLMAGLWLLAHRERLAKAA